MKKLLLLLLLVTPMYFVSCSDNDENEEPKGVNKRISKINVSKSSKDGVKNIVLKFSYDKSGNLIGYKEIETDANGKEGSDILSQVFTYEGNKITKWEEKWEGYPEDNGTTVLEYKKDSIIATITTPRQGVQIDTLIFNKNEQLIKCLYRFNNTYTYEYDSKGNLTKHSLIWNNYKYNCSYTYDDKKSSSLNIGNFPSWFWVYDNNHYIIESGENNVLTMLTEDGISEYKLTASYKYDADGFPTEAEKADTDGYSSKFIFSY